MVTIVQPLFSEEEFTAIRRMLDYLGAESDNYAVLSPEERKDHIFHSVLVLRASGWFNKTLFDTGRIVCTEGATAAMERCYQEASEFIYRHQTGDWGEISFDDWNENDYSVEQGLRILSAFRTKAGKKLWVITESDRSATTILLPEEY